LSLKFAAVNKLASREWNAQDKLQALGEEKRLQEQVLESTQKMLSEHDYSSSTVISSAVSHAVALLKSYIPDLDAELLGKDYPFDEDEEQDTVIDSVYETAQYIVSQYNFFVINDQSDEDSSGTQS
jgi:hypothetical protein